MSEFFNIVVSIFFELVGLINTVVGYFIDIKVFNVPLLVIFAFVDILASIVVFLKMNDADADDDAWVGDLDD